MLRQQEQQADGRPNLSLADFVASAGSGLEDSIGAFAITAGLGAEELAELKARAQAADLAVLDEGETTCCYARSEKHWVTDPQGIAWEHFHTLDSIPVFSEAAKPAMGEASACCATPAPRGKPVGIAVKAASPSSCC